MLLDPWFWAATLGGVPVFWLLPVRLRPWFLAIVSFAYLTSLGATTSVLALVVGALTFWLAPFTVRSKPRRDWVIRGLVAGLLVTLVFWKYGPQIARSVHPASPIASLALPIGLSFYVFRLVHYVLETSRGSIRVTSFGTFLGYLFFLPIFTAGPIEQYDHYLKSQDDRLTRDAAVSGFTRIVHGLVKKLFIAEVILKTQPAAVLLAANESLEARSVWHFLVRFYLYAYMDFSGYSDLAVGLSRLYGIRVVENFRWPVLATSVGDFWKRWHISLSGWTQRYVYMPTIGRYRNPYIAIFATFLVIGAWHDASPNYLAWGLFHGTGVAIALTWGRIKRERRWSATPRGLLRYWGIPVTFTFITLSVSFSTTTGLGLHAAFRLFRGAFGLD